MFLVQITEEMLLQTKEVEIKEEMLLQTKEVKVKGDVSNDF